MDLICRFCGLDLGNDKKCVIARSLVILKFYRSLPSQVRTNDNDLPKNCCSLCNIKICELVEFYDSVLITDRKLKNMLLKRSQTTINKVLPPTKQERLDKQKQNKLVKCTTDLKGDTIGNNNKDKLNNSILSSVSVIYDKLKAKSGITISKFVESDDDEEIDSDCKNLISQSQPILINNSSESETTDNEKGGTTKRKRVKNPQIISLVDMQPKFICARCKGKFKSLEALRHHLETYNDCKDNDVFCKECKRIFKTRRFYFQHICVRRARVKVISREVRVKNYLDL